MNSPSSFANKAKSIGESEPQQTPGRKPRGRSWLSAIPDTNVWISCGRSTGSQLKRVNHLPGDITPVVFDERSLHTVAGTAPIQFKLCGLNVWNSLLIQRVGTNMRGRDCIEVMNIEQLDFKKRTVY